MTTSDPCGDPRREVAPRFGPSCIRDLPYSQQVRLNWAEMRVWLLTRHLELNTRPKGLQSVPDLGGLA